MVFPQDFRDQLADVVGDTPAEARAYFLAVERAGERNIQVREIESMGAQNVVRAARDAIKYASFVLCTDETAYDDARTLIHKSVEPTIGIIVSAISIYSITDAQARAIALGALKVAYTLSVSGFCSITSTMRHEE